MAATLAPARASTDVVQLFRALADETRLAIVRLLTLTDLRAGEVVELLRLPANVTSYHLKQLRSLGVVRDRRSSADARDVYYSLNLDRLQSLYVEAGESLHPALVQAHGTDDAPAYLDRPLRVLFLCTHNSARSQIAEGILRFLGGDQVEAFSAGSAPTIVHPETLDLLHEWGIDTTDCRAKSLSGFAGQTFDYIITVCDRVREECPVFPGDPAQMHWSLPDPLEVEDAALRRQAFRAVRQELQTRICYLLLVPEPGTGRRLRRRPNASTFRGVA